MYGLTSVSRTQRLLLGIFLLLFVDVVWVASSELTKYIFDQKHYDKPYFSTYLKTSMFIIYLLGFIFRRSWWHQCRKNGHSDESEAKSSAETLLSEPIFVPLKYDDKNSGTESDDSSHDSRSVRFSNLSEVRQLSDVHAEEAVLARLSYSAYIRAEEARLRVASKLTAKQVAKIAFIFCIVFFFGNLSYQEALKNTQAGVVNVLSATSGLFTLVLSAMFPSSGSDRFTLSKFVGVLLSVGGIVLVSFADERMESDIPLGALWALSGAVLYAIYLVLLRRRVDNEDKLNMPMFFGFVGLFTMLLMWPGFFVLHYCHVEQFSWPDKMQWLFLLINGLIGTVLSELLWLCKKASGIIHLSNVSDLTAVAPPAQWLAFAGILPLGAFDWGCFLTSSLIATLSLSLTIPMSMMADVILKNVSYDWKFYVGCGPVFIAFFGVTILTHYESWDPVLLAFKKLMQCICRRRLISGPRLRELDREQTESLIGINGQDGLLGRGSDS